MYDDSGFGIVGEGLEYLGSETCMHCMDSLVYIFYFPPGVG